LRIYNYLITRQARHREKRAAGTGIIGTLRRRGRTLLAVHSKDNETAQRARTTMSGSLSAFGGGDGTGEGRERGARRKKLAGYLKAANDIRQSYQQSYSERWGASNGDFSDDTNTIPGSFPDVAIVSHGDEQLILFPSYARRHTKEPPNPELHRMQSSDDEGPGDADYWAREWQKFEDDRAIVDVDVRGWMYSPHRGPMTRKNRLLIGLARQLSGIPAPKAQSREHSPDEPSIIAKHREHEARREEENIARQAEQILKRGEGESKAASQGKYSEGPNNDSDSESIYGEKERSGAVTPSRTPEEAPGPGRLHKRRSWNQPSDMTQAELIHANSHLMARLKPFLTTPFISTPITIFFYDDKTSVSRTVTTNEAGHFIFRAALDFVPTHVRVLASEYLSTTEEVKITEPKGVSIISDVDDTIKHSSIGGGAREIFRNAFIRDLADLTIDGVREWYNTMYDMGVGIHYVSNSPWQLFPVLVSFFRKAGLPPGSYHLKQYSGMLQGIFEPVAERKKGTLERIMRDFPERRFILIGDSGEADLEVYTDVVLANPGKVLAIFIRDVTSPEGIDFFDSTMGPMSSDRRYRQETPSSQQSRNPSTDGRTVPDMSKSDAPEHRPALPPRATSEAKIQTTGGPKMGRLIDFDGDPGQSVAHEFHRRGVNDPTEMKPATDTRVRRPPPPPAKPIALRSASSPSALLEDPATRNKAVPPPPPKPRRPLVRAKEDSLSSPLSQIQTSEEIASEQSYISSARNKMSAAYNALPEVRTYLPGRAQSGQSYNSSSSSVSSDLPPPPPPPRRTATVNSITSSMADRISYHSDASDDERLHPLPTNKKVVLWRERWKRAKDILDRQGVTLRAWRTGGDVCIEAVQIVERTMRQMGVEGYGNGKGKTGQGGGEVKVKFLKR
jgi:phosphatidate phosphatase APP1